MDRCRSHLWLSQIEGRRICFLLPPEDRGRLEEEDPSAGRWQESRVLRSPCDFFDPVGRPKSNGCVPRVAVLGPGESLVVPAGWWHASVTTEACVTLSKRFWCFSNRMGILDELRGSVDLSS